MPCGYVRKIQREWHSGENLRKAIETVKGGASSKPTAIAYEISHGSLSRHRDGKVKQPGTV